MYGPVHGGPCGVQYDEPARYVEKVSDLFSVSGNEYFLPVRGSCMAGGPRPIYAGDVVFMQVRNRIVRPKNGSIAHVEIPLPNGDHEPLLLRYWLDEGSGLVTLLHYKPRRTKVQYRNEEVVPRGELLSVIGNVDGEDGEM
jgi:hypothetical protein